LPLPAAVATVRTGHCSAVVLPVNLSDGNGARGGPGAE